MADVTVFGKTKAVPMTVVEHWRWRYRHPKTGKVHRTSRAMTAQEAARYPDATRIEGTRVLRQAEEQQFPDTTPDVRRASGEP
jgi:hypothetical protein